MPPALRLAVRSLARTPLLSAAAVLMMAVALGACTAVFAVADAVLLAPLPYRGAGSLFVISATQTFGGQSGIGRYSFSELAGWQRPGTPFESVAGWGEASFAVATEGPLRSVDGAFVSDNFFETIGGRFEEGRGFESSDRGAPMAVISARLRSAHFNDGRPMSGRAITLNGTAYTVVGVVARDFELPSTRSDVWVPAAWGPLAAQEDWIRNPRGGGFTFIGRARAASPEAAVRAAADSIYAAQPAVSAAASAARFLKLVQLREWISGAARPVLGIVAAAVGLLLAVACANLTLVLLSRHLWRARDLAVQRALGATRARVVAGAALEAALLLACAAIAGVWIGAMLTRVVRSTAAAWLPRADHVAVAAPSIVAVAALCALVTAIASTIPAWIASGIDVTDALRAGGALEGRTLRGRRARAALVALEIAACVVLLTGAALLARSFARLAGTDIGVAADHLVAVLLDTDASTRRSDPDRLAFSARLITRVTSLPGVSAAGFGTSLPPDAARLRYTLRGVATPGGARDLTVDAIAVTPGFLQALGVHAVSGRLFTDADREGAPPVMLLSETTARSIFGDRDAVGLSLDLPGHASRHEAVRVVGVVSNVRYDGLGKPADGGIYRPYAQVPLATAFLVARTSQPDDTMLAGIRHEIGAVDRDVSVLREDTVRARLLRSVAAPGFRAFLVGSLAMLALALAIAGVFGVVSYSVLVRTAEIGVRMAVGASPAAIVRVVLRDAVISSAAGAALGVGASALGVRWMSSLLYGVSPGDPASYAMAVGAVLALAAAAAYVPARRATKLDPMTALHVR